MAAEKTTPESTREAEEKCRPHSPGCANGLSRPSLGSIGGPQVSYGFACTCGRDAEVTAIAKALDAAARKPKPVANRSYCKCPLCDTKMVALGTEQMDVSALLLDLAASLSLSCSQTTAGILGAALDRIRALPLRSGGAEGEKDV